MSLGIGGRNVDWLKETAERLQEIVRERGANAIHISAKDDYIRFSIRLTNDTLYTAKRTDDSDDWEFSVACSGKRGLEVRELEALEVVHR